MIDKADGTIDGIPVDLGAKTKGNWIQLFSKEFNEIQHKSNDINSYGATSLPEFFAVVVEYFKESPSKLEQNHKELFHLLNDYFNDRHLDNH